MENKNVREQILRSYGKNPRKCMSCGKCTATCPSYDNMEYHPHQFVSMVINGKIDALLESESLYTCLSCMACLERCPRAGYRFRYEKILEVIGGVIIYAKNWRIRMLVRQ